MSSSLIDVVRPYLPADLEVPDCLDAEMQRDLLHALGEVPDPRGRRGVRYRLASLLAVAVCAVLAGATTFTAIADWAADLDPTARRRLGLPGRIPAISTVWRFLVRVDATVLQAVLTGWLRRRTTTPTAGDGRSGRVVIAVDGKALRGARLPQGRQVHLLSAYDTTSGMVLAQVAVAAKSNEIPAFAPLLEQVQARLGSLAGTIIVADALHAQVGHANTVAAGGGQLMVTVKANRPRLLAQLRRLPWAQVPVGHRTRSRGHGRRETRTVKTVTVATPEGLEFPHAAQAVRITRSRTLGGKTTRETAYLVVSLPAAHAQPVDLSDWARRAWHIENRLHLSPGVGRAASTSTTTVTWCRYGSLFQRYQRMLFNGWNGGSGVRHCGLAGGRDADVDGARRRFPHGAAGRGLVGGAPAAVVAEHGARLRDGVGAVVDVSGAAR